MNCLLVINEMSGNAAKINERDLLSKYAAEDNVSVKRLLSPSDDYSVTGVEKLIVCGGDGTLFHALEACSGKEIDLYYYPCGTFNERAKATGGDGVCPLESCGKIGETPFSYVAAAGSFTDLGQAATSSAKQRFKIFAYFAKVLSSYKVHRIRASLKTERHAFDGTFTLIMISNAKRCFGFPFNRLHKKRTNELQLIAIRAPKKDNLWGRIKMFFPFFRAFFLGVSKEHIGKNLIVTSFQKGVIRLLDNTTFCLDGESATLSGELTVEKQKEENRLFLINE